MYIYHYFRINLQFPLEVFPAKVKDFITNASYVKDAPPEFIAASIIAGGGILISTNAFIKIKNDWKEPCVLWTGLIAKPGIQMKSPCFNEIKITIDTLDQDLGKKYDEEKEDYDKKIIIYKQDLKRWEETYRKSSSIAGNPPNMPIEPVRELIFTSDTTKEGMSYFQSINKNGIAGIKDELSSILRGMNLYNNGKGNDEQYFLSSFNGERTIITRKGEKKPIAVRPYHNFWGTTQIDEAEKLLFASGTSTTGFTERWLLALSDYEKRGGITDDEINQELSDNLHNLLVDLYKFFGKKDQPVYYCLSSGAKQIFYEYINKVDAETKNKSNPDLLISYLVKTKAFVARIALILHCLEDKEPLEISAQTVINSTKVVQYYISCFQRISNISLDAKNLSKEHYVLNWLKTKGLTQVTASDLYKSNKSRYKDIDDAVFILENLAGMGQGQFISAGNGKNKFILNIEG